MACVESSALATQSFLHSGQTGTIILFYFKSADTDGRKPYKYGNLRGESPSGLKGKRQCKHVLGGTCTETSCDFWHSPVSVSLYALRLVGSPVKSEKKGGAKGLVALLKETIQLGCVLYEPSEKIDSAGKWKVGIESHSQVLEGHDASRKISGKEGSIAGNHSKVLKFEERTQDETLTQEWCARRDA